MRCELIVGRLIAHPCSLRAQARCADCGAACCPRHLAPEPAARCVRCAGAPAPAEPLLALSAHELFDFDEDELAAFEPDRSAPAALHFDS